MRQAWCAWGAGVVITTMVIGLNGCGDVLPADGLSGRALLGERTLQDLTAGDLVAAFESFRNGELGSRLDALPADLRAEIESLHADFALGELSALEFATAVRELLGDRLPDRAFGGFDFLGAPFGLARSESRTGVLALTPEQRAQAFAIFATLHENVGALRREAVSDISALLTLEQLATLESAWQQRTPRESGQPDRAARRHALSELLDSLDISSAQKQQIGIRREELRAAVRAEHEAAREAFRGLLTPAQLTVLESIERPNLDLTPQQREEIREILARYRSVDGDGPVVELLATGHELRELVKSGADEAALRTAAEGLGDTIASAAMLAAQIGAELRAVLTAEQLETLEALVAERRTARGAQPRDRLPGHEFDGPIVETLVAFQPDLEAARTAVRATRSALRDTVRDPAATEDEISAAANALAGAVADVVVLIANARSSVASLLTPAQLEQIESWQQQRAERWEQIRTNRAERREFIVDRLLDEVTNY